VRETTSDQFVPHDIMQKHPHLYSYVTSFSSPLATEIKFRSM